MKKIFTLLSLAVLACVSAIAAINWDKVDNLAKGATVTVSSNPGDAGLICDGNDGTGWQANAATHAYTHDWLLINLGEGKTFTDIEIVWEASHCKKYSVYVSDSEIPYTEKSTEGEAPVNYNEISADWLAANQPVAVRGNDSEAGYTDNISLATPLQGQYVLIYADEYNNFGSQYGMRIFDVKIANIENRDAVDALELTAEGNAVAGGDPITVNVVPVNKIGDVLALDKVTDMKLTCDKAAVTITGENGVYSVSATEVGTYTLTATAKAGDNTVSGVLTLNVAFNWNDVENIATGKTVQGRVKADTEDPNPPSNAVDGNLETYYQYNGEWGGGDGWLLIDLGDVYMVDAIGAYYSTNAGGKCVFGYATDASAIEAKIAADGTDFVWKNIPTADEGWTFTSELTRTADAVTTQAYATPVVARYIVVKDADNPQGKPCVNEIYVAGTKREAPKADALRLTLEKDGMVIGETNTVSAEVVDQYGEPFEATPVITVSGAEYSNGVITADAKGMVTVTATVDGISAEKKFYVADENDYCLDGAIITASEGAESNTVPVTDGGKVITNDGLPFQLSINEAAGAHEHWVLIQLAKPYDLDLIAVLWEGACPADYDVYLGETENSLQKYYSQKDKEGLRNYSDRFSGEEMKNIQYIKVVTTKNATGYGLKLFDIKAYGTSNVVSVVDKVEVSASDNYIVTGTDVTLSAKVYDQFGAEMQDREVTYSCDNATVDGNVFSASNTGVYTVTATCGTVSGEIDINVVAESKDRLSAEALAGTITLDGVTQTADIFNGTEISIPDVPATLVITFDNPQNFSLVNIKWEAACPSDYTVVATYANGATATVLTVADRNFVNGVFPVDKIVSNAKTARSAEVGTGDLKNVKALTFDIKAKDHEYPVRLLGIEAYSDGSQSSAIDNIIVDGNAIVDVYNLQGVKVRSNVKVENALDDLPRGIYIVGGRKVIR